MSHLINGWRRIRYFASGGAPTDISSFTDTNSFLNGTPSDDGAKITVPMLGSKQITSPTSSPHPKNGIWAAVKLYDAYGRPVTGDVSIAMSMRIRFSSTPSVNDNLTVAMGLVNESDLTSGTIDGIHFSTAYRNATSATGGFVQAWNITNGSVANQTNGTATAGVAGGEAAIARIGRSTSKYSNTNIFAIDSSKSTVTGAGFTANLAVTDGGTGQQYVLCACWRNDNTDTDNISPGIIWEYVPPGMSGT